MSEQIREQVSAFLDGELPNSETELLLKRLTRDAELRESFGRYALIGEAVRGASPGVLTKGFAARVNLAIDGEPRPQPGMQRATTTSRWWRPLASISVAAGVAAVAIVTFQQRSSAPGSLPSGAVVARVSSAQPHPAGGSPVGVPLTAQNREELSYTVPTPSADAPASLAPARLTNYVFAHSKYSSGLGQRGVLADLLIEDDAPVVAPQVPPPQPPVLRAAP
jgi:sigma-E factor negative regulatory protein RseA